MNDMHYQNRGHSGDPNTGVTHTMNVKLFNDKCGLAVLISTEAAKAGKNIVERNINATAQIRRFYDEVLALKEKSDNSTNEEFTKLLPAIYLVASKAAYSKGRKTISDFFKDFIQKNILAIKTKEDLDNFALYFEAVYGYFRFEEKNNQRG